MRCYQRFVSLSKTVFCIVFIGLLYGCVGPQYQAYDGRLGYQEKMNSDGELIITYVASDSTDWFTIGTFVDKRLREKKKDEPCVGYKMIRDEQSEQRVTIKRTVDAQYLTVQGLGSRWDIRTHEPIELDVPANVRVYHRVLKSQNIPNCHASVIE